MYTGVALNTDISKGVFDRFRSLPIWRPAVLVGALLGDAGPLHDARRRWCSCSGCVLGFRPEGGVVGSCSAMLLLLVFAFSLSWIWTILGLMMRTPESVMQMSMMILFPLTFATQHLRATRRRCRAGCRRSSSSTR